MISSEIVSIAFKTALKSPIKHKYCAILFHNNKPISYGYNTFDMRCRLNGQCVL